MLCQGPPYVGEPKPGIHFETKIVQPLDLFKDYALVFQHDSGKHAFPGGARRARM